MFNVILAMTKSKGIGFKGQLPWVCKEELSLFRQKTMNSLIITGKRTAKSLPPLKGREVVVLSQNDDMETIQKDCKVHVSSVYKSLNECFDKLKRQNVFIIGGGTLYDKVMNDSFWKKNISNVHLSIMKNEFKCDTFVDFKWCDWTIQDKTEYSEFTHYVLSPRVSCESQYLNLLGDVYTRGCVKSGRNGETISDFGKTLVFDQRRGFPLLTTKKMFFRGIVEELLFFIRGQTDSKVLENKKINIWKGNTSRSYLDSVGFSDRKEGILGPMYGYQWRYFNAPYDVFHACPKTLHSGIDQLKKVIYLIRTDPHSRRIMMTDFNPSQVDQGVLPPCHSIIIQFYVSSCGTYLDMFCYNRSSDLFHGLPFNIASSSLLHIIIGKLTQKIPRTFTLSLGDTHIYKSHTDVVQEQLCRIPFESPKLTILKDLDTLEDVEKLEYKDFRLEQYSCHPSLKVDMVC